MCDWDPSFLFLRRRRRPRLSEELEDPDLDPDPDPDPDPETESETDLPTSPLLLVPPGGIRTATADLFSTDGQVGFCQRQPPTLPYPTQRDSILIMTTT